MGWPLSSMTLGFKAGTQLISSYLRLPQRILLTVNFEPTQPILCQKRGNPYLSPQTHKRGGEGEQCPGHWITAGGAEKSQQCRKYFLHHSRFASERLQVWPWGTKPASCPRAPCNLATPPGPSRREDKMRGCQSFSTIPFNIIQGVHKVSLQFKIIIKKWNDEISQWGLFYVNQYFMKFLLTLKFIVSDKISYV